MTTNIFVESTYELFSNFVLPLEATDVEHCLECRDHNEEIGGADRRELLPSQIGTECWGIIRFLTPKAMGYYLPRFIELAVMAQNGKDDEPFMCQYLNQIGLSSGDECFSLLTREQRSKVCESLNIIKIKYYNVLVEHCWEDEIDEAIEQWST